MRLTIEGIKERQEWEIVNSKKFGLLHSVDPAMRISTRYGAPTPDDLDELLALVWKKPAFFLAHPKAIAAFERECTWRGVPPVTINLFGTPVVTWRGVPLVPCDKLDVKSRYSSNQWFGTTSILLLRVGEADQGVVGLHQAGIPGEIRPSLSARLMGLDSLGVASYLLTLYFSCAVLTDDALGILENVEVGYYHDYEHRKARDQIASPDGKRTKSMSDLSLLMRSPSSRRVSTTKCPGRTRFRNRKRRCRDAPRGAPQVGCRESAPCRRSCTRRRADVAAVHEQPGRLAGLCAGYPQGAPSRRHGLQPGRKPQ